MTMRPLSGIIFGFKHGQDDYLLEWQATERQGCWCKIHFGRIRGLPSDALSISSGERVGGYGGAVGKHVRCRRQGIPEEHQPEAWRPLHESQGYSAAAIELSGWLLLEKQADLVPLLLATSQWRERL